MTFNRIIINGYLTVQKKMAQAAKGVALYSTQEVIQSQIAYSVTG